MKSRTLYSSIAFVMLAAFTGTGGSQAAGTQTQKLQDARVCYGPKCQAVVTVDAACGVTVAPYFLVMVPQPVKERPGSFSPITVEWTITGGTFVDTEPIRWKDFGAGHVFHTPQLAKDRVSVTNSGARGIYHYGIRVLDKYGKPCPELDPTGINEPP